MSLIESLLDAIVRLDGDALVLHVGEKPYVITSSSAMNAFRGPLSWGQVELSTRVLSLESLGSMLEQLLTPGQRELLGEMGAVEHELPATADRPAFTIIAARGGDDVWLEVRPVRPKAVEAVAAVEIPPVEEPVVSVTDVPEAADVGFPEAPAVERPDAIPAEIPEEIPVEIPEAVAAEILEAIMAAPDSEPADSELPELPDAAPTVEGWEPFGPVAPAASDAPAPEPAVIEPANTAGQGPSFEVVPEVEQAHPDEDEVTELIAAAGWLEADAARVDLGTGDEPVAVGATGDVPVEIDQPVQASETTAPFDQMEQVVEECESAPTLAGTGPTPIPDTPAWDPAAQTVTRPEPTFALPQDLSEPEDRVPDLEEVPFSASEPGDELRTAVVLPLARTLRDQPSSPAELPSSKPSLDRLLRIAAARGASGLYLVAQSRPVVRVDGEMQPVDGEELLSAGDVEAFTLGLTSEPNREAVRSGATSEWFSDLPELGRVRCFTFSDHRGPGVIVRMLPARAISVEQLGLSRDIRALCEQPDGLVLVAGPRASGKSTLIAAFVELINRSRADHVVTIERQITFVHESRRSFVSQREVRGEAEAIATAVRGALREDPDVLVIEELRSADVAAAAIEAAESGRLVLAGLRASAAAPAIERLVEQFPSERRGQILRSLAGTLRGVVAQVLLRKRGGGRIAARELLLNTPAASSVIADGKLFQLGAALESGRKFGNVALNDTLLSLIRDGIVDAGEAWRRSHDREGLLTLLKREGIDTSFVERLA